MKPDNYCNLTIFYVFLISDSLDPETVFILANAVYFRGIWKFVFEPGDTEEMRFFPEGIEGQTTMVQMMKQSAYFLYGKITSLDCEALALPYMVDYMIFFLTRDF